MPGDRQYVVRLSAPDDLNAYREMLRTTIYPATEQLEDNNLIDAFYLQRRDERLELHLRLEEDVEFPSVEGVLQGCGIKARLEPGDQLPDAEVDTLDAVSCLVRLIHDADDPDYRFNQAIHHACVQFGFPADAQAYWHIVQAFVWLHTHFAIADTSMTTLQLADHADGVLKAMTMKR